MKHLPSWYKITEQEYAWARLCGYEIHYDNDSDRVIWFLDGKKHRTDGPACEWADGTRSWWLNGLRHRTDGPAVECADGDREWWLNGKRHTEEDFDEALARLV